MNSNEIGKILLSAAAAVALVYISIALVYPTPDEIVANWANREPSAILTLALAIICGAGMGIFPIVKTEFSRSHAYAMLSGLFYLSFIVVYHFYVIESLGSSLTYIIGLIAGLVLGIIFQNVYVRRVYQ